MTERFNFIILDGNVIQNGGEKFLLGKVGGGRFSLCKTAVQKFCCKSYWFP